MERTRKLTRTASPPPAAVDEVLVETVASAPTAGLGPVDAAISAAVLAVLVAVSLPVGLRLHNESKDLERQRMQLLDQNRALLATLGHLEARRDATMELRRVVDRYVADVQSRPMVAWTTAVGELSRSRPNGVWATRMSGNGPRFRLQVKAARPDLLAAYTRRLRESAYVEFAALPAEAGTSSSGQVVGRLVGE